MINKKEEKVNFICIRNKLVPKQNIPKDKLWQLQTPKDIRAESIRDLIKAFQSNFSKKSKQSNHKFKMKYKSKKSLTQSITIAKTAVKFNDNRSVIIYPRITGDQRVFKLKESIPAGVTCKFDFDVRILQDHGKWYICVPYEVPKADENQAAGGIISLDPGVRTFQTGYSPDGVVYEFGNKDFRRIYRLAIAADKLQSKLSRCKKNIVNYKKRRKKIYWYRIALRKIRYKVKNLIKELHDKIINFLCKSFKMIILPEFPSMKMSNKWKRKIGKSTTRSMLTWSHYRFRTKLQEKSKEYKGCQVVVVDEHYTSKTCGSCGCINSKLGSCKVFKCVSSLCDLHIDRDANGARNILLRALSDTTTL